MIRLFTHLAIMALMLGQLSIATEAAQGFSPAPQLAQEVEKAHGCCDMDMSTPGADECAKYCAQAVLSNVAFSARPASRVAPVQLILPLQSILDWPTGPPPIFHHNFFRV